MKFSINTDRIKKLERELEKFGSRALPRATKDALNSAAFSAMRIAKAAVSRDMVMRNKFTVKSIRVKKATSLNPRNQMSTVGSIAPYMEDQEFGARVSKPGPEGVPIPTSFSSGEGLTARPRKRVPRKPNRLGNIRFNQSAVKAQSRKRRNIAKVRQAVKSGSKYVFLRLKRSRGIFKVVGGKRKPRIKMVIDMTRNSIQIPKNPWLRPAMIRAQRLMPSFYVDAIRFHTLKLGLKLLQTRLGKL